MKRIRLLNALTYLKKENKTINDKFISDETSVIVKKIILFSKIKEYVHFMAFLSIFQ